MNTKAELKISQVDFIIPQREPIKLLVEIFLIVNSHYCHIILFMNKYGISLFDSAFKVFRIIIVIPQPESRPIYVNLYEYSLL